MTWNPYSLKYSVLYIFTIVLLLSQSPVNSWWPEGLAIAALSQRLCLCWGQLGSPDLHFHLQHLATKTEENWFKKKKNMRLQQRCSLLKDSRLHRDTKKVMCMVCSRQPEEGVLVNGQPRCGGSVEASRGGQIRSSRRDGVSQIIAVTQPFHREKARYVIYPPPPVLSSWLFIFSCRLPSGVMSCLVILGKFFSTFDTLFFFLNAHLCSSMTHDWTTRNK